jgi:3-hydroxybutyryl-CoA dehydrogenase
MVTVLDRTWEAPVPVGADLPPAQRLQSGLLADAVAMAARGLAGRADIDLAMRLGAGHPQGPFAVLDGLGSAADPFGPLPGAGAATTTETGSADDTTWAGPVGVVGTGHMASGIVEAVARTGRPVLVVGRSPEALERLRATVAGSLGRSAAKGRISADDVATTLARIDLLTDPATLAGVDVVVEAVAENLAVKQALFAELDRALPRAVPLATNTSSLRVSEIAAGVTTGRPVLGLHFFNPAPAMKLVEVIAGPDAGHLGAPATAWVRALGKTPVPCADSRGFIVNRLLIPFLNDAVRVHEQGVAVAEIDALMVEQAGHPMGPFALIDLIGLDVTAAALAAMAETDTDPRLPPAATLRTLVERGRLGRKSGAGFHTYGERR